MPNLAQANRSVDPSRFAMVPTPGVQRTSFRVPTNYKTTMNFGLIVPWFVDEVLPGDTIAVHPFPFARLETALTPVMDNMFLDFFWFFVPYRLVWSNFRKFMGEQINPADSIDYLIPQCVSPAGGYAIGSIFDYMGLPTVGQVNGASTVTHSALPLRAYNLVYNEWFRDQNLINTITQNTGDGPDGAAAYGLQRRGKRHDYFTSALPWPKKPIAPLTVAGIFGQGMLNMARPDLGAPVSGIGILPATATVAPTSTLYSGGRASTPALNQWSAGAGLRIDSETMDPGAYPGIRVLIEDIRIANTLQLLAEREARAGTRYVEIIRNIFGVISPDQRLQRPEYLGGGSVPINMTPVGQTSATAGGAAHGDLAGVGTAAGGNVGFRASFVEHGVLLGLVSARVDITYQQGMRKMWSRLTKHDFFWPDLQMLGEQPIFSREIYCDGQAADANVFGYQERYAEYKYFPSMITGRLRSTAASTLDIWHLAQTFNPRPVLNSTFIEQNPPISRVLADGVTATNNSQELKLDCHALIEYTRPIAMFSVPGLAGRF